jgi:hypothetical protein
MLMQFFLSEFILNYEMKPVPNQPEPTVEDDGLAPITGPGYKVVVTPREDFRNELGRGKEEDESNTVHRRLKR